MNTRFLILPAIVIVDSLTKMTVHQNLGGVQYHYTHVGIWFLIPIVLCIWMVVKYPFMSLPLSVAITGALLNYLDVQDGMGINPFILVVRETIIGFNVADLAIMLGVCATLIELIRHRKQIGSVKWNNV